MRIIKEGSGNYRIMSDREYQRMNAFWPLSWLFDVFEWIMVRLFFVLIALIFAFAVLVFGGQAIGAWVGLIKSTVIMELQPTSVMELQQASIRSIALEGRSKYEESVASFDADGKALLSIAKGDNEVFFEYDGMSVWLGTYEGNGFANYLREETTFDQLTSQMKRTFIMEVTDESGRAVEDAVLWAQDDMGKGIAYGTLAGGTYALVLPQETKMAQLKVQADGYQTASVTLDLSKRLTTGRLMLRSVMQ